MLKAKIVITTVQVNFVLIPVTTTKQKLPGNPSCLQITVASWISNPISQIVPHSPSLNTSIRPSRVVLFHVLNIPSTNRSWATSTMNRFIIQHYYHVQLYIFAQLHCNQPRIMLYLIRALTSIDSNAGKYHLAIGIVHLTLVFDLPRFTLFKQNQ